MSDMGDMMMDLPTRLESWAQNEELVASGTERPGGQQAGIPASAFCNRVVAPFITGSNDPLVAATYCKEGK